MVMNGHIWEKLSKIFFSRTYDFLIFSRPKILQLGMRHWGHVLQSLHNDDLGLTLTYFMARSNLIVYAFEWGETVFMSFNGKKKQTITELTEGLCFQKDLTPGVFCLCSGDTYMYITFIYKDIFL